jgi:hypothetical protein
LYFPKYYSRILAVMTRISAVLVPPQRPSHDDFLTFADINIVPKPASMALYPTTEEDASDCCLTTTLAANLKPVEPNRTTLLV